jgi:isoaspartyl peptidase/L-asparaginase-like protein (Ntn-hydrolase superfamily)
VTTAAGIIVADPRGQVGYACNTEHMVVVYMQPHLPDFVLHT